MCQERFTHKVTSLDRSSSHSEGNKFHGITSFTIWTHLFKTILLIARMPIFLQSIPLSLVGKLIEAVKKFSSSRLIMNSSWLWNSHQRHKFLRVEASRDILKFRVSEMPFPGVFQRYFSTADALLLCQTTGKTGNNAVEMSQVFHDITQFERFTILNLFKYAFNVIQNWEMNALPILFDGAYFLLAVMVEGYKSSQLRLAN